MSNTYLAGEQTKRRILKESKKLFYKNGYTETTYTDISAAAKINRALIPYHFKNKQVLGLEIYNGVITNFMTSLNEILDISEFTPDFASIIHIIAYYRLLKNAEFSRFVYQLQLENPPLFTTEQEKRLISGLGNKLTKLTDAELDIAANLSIGMKKELIHMIYHSKYAVDIDQLAKMNLHMLMSYAGYSEKKAAELTDAATQVVNLFSFQVKTGFSIEIKYN